MFDLVSISSVVLFIIAGALLKTIDILSDKLETGDYDSKGKILILGYSSSIFCAFTFIMLSYFSNFFGLILISIILGSLFGKKIDSNFFLLGLIIYIVGILSTYPFIIMTNLFLLLILTGFSTIDEIGHTWFESQTNVPRKYVSVNFLFKYRFLLKIGLILLFLLLMLDGISVLGFLFFDLSYLLVDIYIKKNKK
ncbi:MAG: hypothetical protein ACTSUV_06930 [Candidatus Ranarchaeia archaeon]